MSGQLLTSENWTNRRQQGKVRVQLFFRLRWLPRIRHNERFKFIFQLKDMTKFCLLFMVFLAKFYWWWCILSADKKSTVKTRDGVSKCGARFETLLQGPTQWCIEVFEGVNQGVVIEIGGVTKARPERVMPRPLQQRLQWTAPLKSINRRITTLINTSSLARHLPDQSYECSTCREERYWVLC